MSALPILKQEPVQEIMARLFRAGFTLIPLGGPDGKKPLITGWTDRRLSLEACLKRMANGHSQTYGVRLDSSLVVDIDTDNEETRSYIAGRFDPSSVTVRTARGIHHYYRHDGIVPQAVRTSDIAIDFKAGSHAFVVGPGSIRPDGRRYSACDGDLAFSTLPTFRDRQPLQTVANAGKIPEGQRNTKLYKCAVEYAPFADNFDGLMADLVALRDIEFDDSASVPDSEISKVAEWAWSLRLEGRLWMGRNSAVQIYRSVADALLIRKDGADAFALYYVLVSNHGHIPGRTFAIVPDAMIEAGHISMSRSAAYRARAVLLEEHLISRVRTGKRGPHRLEADQFRLNSPQMAVALKGNSNSRGGRGFTSYINPIWGQEIEGDAA